MACTKLFENGINSREKFFMNIIEGNSYHRFAKFLHSQTFLLRKYIYRVVALKSARNVIDAGCGYGEITQEMSLLSRGTVIGIDKDEKKISSAVSLPENGRYLVADLEQLPFQNAQFDFAFFHFSLMWCKVSNVLDEIYRVLKKNGWVAAIEPDYDGRVEYPDTGAKKVIVEKLMAAGADPFIGRKMYHIFSEKKFIPVEYGVMSWKYNPNVRKEEMRDEQEMFSVTPPDIVYMPIFWIIARKA
ncbi:MAG: class I SAM-dependent methyltransferase [Candidatus Korarchaeota archaeon]